MGAEVASVSSNAAEQPGYPPARVPESVDEQARRRGLHPIGSVDELARDDVFESDEELDAFLTHLYASRRADLG
jgi:hypothetical protein